MKGNFLFASAFNGMALAVCAGMFLSSCGGGKNESASAVPENFAVMGDTARVAYVMERATPDSVARFICSAALGRLDYARIDSLGIATSYAYEKYSGADLDLFGETYDSYVSALALPDKMRMYAMAGVEDPQGLGLQLGLEYMQSVREKNMSVGEVEKELNAFREACGRDSATYRRFLVGFRTVLESDRGKDMPQEIYDRFINFDKDF